MKTNGFTPPQAPAGQLPPTTDKEFWAPDGVLNAEQYNPDTRGVPSPNTHGNFRVQNGMVVCTMCANQHSLPVDLSKYDILDGKIIRRHLTQRSTV